MMKKIAVIYKTVYGTTKRYAEWIAEELNASLLEASKVKPKQLASYDIVVFGGGLYASGIIGVKLVINNPCGCLVVFTVGAATPENTDYTDILNKSFTKDMLSRTRVFHLHGGIDYSKLKPIHKAMMALVKKSVEKKSFNERETDDPEFLTTYGNKFDFTDKSAISPLVEYVRSL
jgi:menaquinone-dependent protoporphyrinogen IX oxidase